jgi:hypothetical protein
VPHGPSDKSLEFKLRTTVARGGDRLSGAVHPLKAVVELARSRIASFFGAQVIRPDFDRITQYEKADSLLSLSILRHTEQIVNAGWTVQSKDPVPARYVMRRLHEMGQRMGVPVSKLIVGIVYDTVRFCNAAVYLHRNTRLSPGEAVPFVNSNRELVPIVAAEQLPIPQLTPRVNAGTNRIGHWSLGANRWSLGGRQLPADNVVLFTFCPDPGSIFATPWVMPALDDIQDLRATEAVINSIIQQQGAPLYHVKIENPAIDLESGTSEVLVVRSQIENGGLEGGFYVSDARHSIEPISNAAALNTYQWVADHYKSRAREGLDLTALDLGEGDSANRNTAGSLTEKGVSRCKFLALPIEETINFALIEPLLLEGGFQWDFSEKGERQRAVFSFREIDVDRKMRQQIHKILLWEANGLTHEELRQALDLEALTDDQWSDTHVTRVLIEQIKAKGLYGGAGAIGDEGGQAKQRLASKNQHGTSVAPKTAKDALDVPVAALERLCHEAIEHYKSGLAVSGRSSRIGTPDQADSVFQIRHRLARNLLGTGEDAEASRLGEIALGNLIRGEAFFLGADGKIPSP